VSLVYEDDAAWTQQSTTLRATLIRPWRRGALGKVSVVTAGVGGGSEGARFAEAGVTIEFGLSGTLTLAGRGASANAHFNTITVTYSRLFDFARMSVQTQTAGSSHATVLDVGSALAIDPTARPLIEATASPRSAGVTGFVYYDENADGVFDAGDRPAEHATVLVGGLAANVNARGGFRVWNVPAYDPVPVRVDSLADMDPAYSQYPIAPLRATPNMFNPIELRLVRVNEVSGRVELGGAPAPGGVRLRLEDPAARLHYETLTFDDGTFSFDRVFPGTYQLQVNERALAALGATGEPVSIQVPSANAIVVRIVPRG
jgi:hypothetical protein